MHLSEQDRRDLRAQWAFDTRPILGRFHLWLEDVDIEWMRGLPAHDTPAARTAFLTGRIERLFAVTGAVTALGTQLFGQFGEGKGRDKPGLNQVKKNADAISAYAMSEGLWYLSRQLPENHAIMVCLGEGLMPKAGETPEMGANPQLGFGRVYARPDVARWLDERVTRLLNDAAYGWNEFYADLATAHVTVWGTAIDTLENTSRFALGHDTGPMTVLHVFDQPLNIVKPYEGYMGTLFLPQAVIDAAVARSILITFRTPRRQVLEAIELAYPGIRREHIHVWTLGGKSRVARIGNLWQTWRDLGVHVVEDGWTLPTGLKAFTDSGTYAPTYGIGTWLDEAGDRHLLICDGYAASAEAVQAASLAPMFELQAFLNVFTSTLRAPLRPGDGGDGARRRRRRFRRAPWPARRPGAPDAETVAHYSRMIHEARDAGLPLDVPALRADDFFPQKRWDVLAVASYMRDDPYTGAPGVEEVAPDTYRVTTRLASMPSDKRVTLTLRLLKPRDEARLVFIPLLHRFLAGADYTTRAVKISDSGRIRNELQTLCADALEFLPCNRIRVHLDRIPPEVVSPTDQATLHDVLRWYKSRHPIWFSWMELAETSA